MGRSVKVSIENMQLWKGMLRDEPFDIRVRAREFFEEQNILLQQTKNKNLSRPILEKNVCHVSPPWSLTLTPYKWWENNNLTYQGDGKKKFVSPRWWEKKCCRRGVTNKNILSRPQLHSPLLILNGASLKVHILHILSLYVNSKFEWNDINKK